MSGTNIATEQWKVFDQYHWFVLSTTVDRALCNIELKSIFDYKMLLRLKILTTGYKRVYVSREELLNSEGLDAWFVNERTTRRTIQHLTSSNIIFSLIRSKKTYYVLNLPALIELTAESIYQSTTSKKYKETVAGLLDSISSWYASNDLLKPINFEDSPAMRERKPRKKTEFSLSDLNIENVKQQLTEHKNEKLIQKQKKSLEENTLEKPSVPHKLSPQDIKRVIDSFCKENKLTIAHAWTEVTFGKAKNWIAEALRENVDLLKIIKTSLAGWHYLWEYFTALDPYTYAGCRTEIDFEDLYKYRGHIYKLFLVSEDLTHPSTQWMCPDYVRAKLIEAGCDFTHDDKDHCCITYFARNLSYYHDFVQRGLIKPRG